MIVFEEKDHKYYNPTDETEQWISVTSLLHLFEPRKDWEKIKERYAKKNGLSVEEVTRMWKEKNQKAIERGVKFHRERELELVSCDHINGLSIRRPVMQGELKIATDQKLEPGIYPELLVYLKSALVCGQADYVEITQDGLINIKDFKTNQEIKMNGFVNWDGVEEMMTGPLNHIPNCNYWLYALQLNTYAYIIRRNNPRLKLGKLELLHIQFDEQDEVMHVQPYVLPDLQAVVKDMLDYYKNNKSNL